MIMTARERVLASRLIQKIDDNENYASQIGLSYEEIKAGDYKNNSKPNRKTQKKY